MASEYCHLESISSLAVLKGALVCETGVHVGTGEHVSPGAADLSVAKDAAGRPFLPGSSLKGVLRSAAERILRSLVEPRPLAGIEGRIRPLPAWACLLHATDDDCCLTTSRDLQGKLSSLQEGRSEMGLSRWIAERTCAVCRLFGSPHLAGRIWMKDAFLAEEASPLEVRSGVAVDRDRRAQKPGQLFDLEIVPPATRFDLQIRVENADEYELGLLFLALDQLSQGEIRIGGRGTAGLGAVRLEPHTLLHLSPRRMGEAAYRRELLSHLLDLRPAALSGEALTDRWQVCRDAFARHIRSLPEPSSESGEEGSNDA